MRRYLQDERGFFLFLSGTFCRLRTDRDPRWFFANTLYNIIIIIYYIVIVYRHNIVYTHVGGKHTRIGAMITEFAINLKSYFSFVDINRLCIYIVKKRSSFRDRKSVPSLATKLYPAIIRPNTYWRYK